LIAARLASTAPIIVKNPGQWVGEGELLTVADGLGVALLDGVGEV